MLSNPRFLISLLTLPLPPCLSHCSCSLQIWQRMAEYLHAHLIKTVDLSPEQSYVFAAYPHGISAIGGWLSFATEATGFSTLFPGARGLLTFRAVFSSSGSCSAAACTLQAVLVQA